MVCAAPSAQQKTLAILLTCAHVRGVKKNAPGRIAYPEETPGSRLAAKARKLANKLTPEQRREHFNGAMTMIYGGAKEATLARR